MAKKIKLERLREVLRYDSDNGEFWWRVKPSKYAHRVDISNPAGFVKPDGYRQIKIDGVTYREHRLAWLYVHGEWPAEQIDHIDLDRSNNRIDNLREATHSENMCNSSLYANNKSGFKGVYWNKKLRRWMARIGVSGKLIYIGLFDCPSVAHDAYCEAAKKYHGEFARTE